MMMNHGRWPTACVKWKKLFRNPPSRRWFRSWFWSQNHFYHCTVATDCDRIWPPTRMIFVEWMRRMMEKMKPDFWTWIWIRIWTSWWKTSVLSKITRTDIGSWSTHCSKCRSIFNRLVGNRRNRTWEWVDSYSWLLTLDCDAVHQSLTDQKTLEEWTAENWKPNNRAMGKGGPDMQYKRHRCELTKGAIKWFTGMIQAMS